MIERKCSECGVNEWPSADTRHILGRKNVCQNDCNDFCGARHNLRKFNYHMIAGGERIYKRSQCEQQRVVPSTDNTNHAKRSVLEESSAWPQKPCGFNISPAHPVFQISPGMPNLVVERKQLE